MSRASLLLLLQLCSCAGAQRPAPSTVTLQILSTNDLHGQLEPVDLLTGESPPRSFRVGGAEALAATITELRARRPRGTVLLDAGDTIQGTLLSNAFKGQPVAELMRLLGYDAAVIGNHEFDFGRGALRSWIRAVGLPVLSSNITPALPGVRPSLLLSRDGIRIGVVGVTTPQTRVTTIPTHVSDLHFAPMLPAVVREARALRAAGTTVVIVVAHAGGSCEGRLCRGEVFERLVDRLPRGLVDVVVAGHTHQCLRRRVNGVVVVQACAKGVAVGRVELVIDTSTRRVISAEALPPAIACRDTFSDTGGCEGLGRRGRPRGTLAPRSLRQPRVRRLLDRYRRRLGSGADAVLATSRRPIGRGSGALGALFARALLEAVPGADMAVINAAALRADLPAGPIRYHQLFSAFPFDNKLAVVRLTGRQVRRLFTLLLQRSHGLPQVANVRLRLRCGAPPKLLGVLVANRSLEPERVYKVVINDFLLAGGGGLGPLVSSLERDQRQIYPRRTVRAEIAKYLRALGSPVVAGGDETVTFVDGPCKTHETSPRFLCR